MSKIKIFSLLVGMCFIFMCVPPEDTGGKSSIDKEKLDSLRNLRCPRLMSSAAEYYRNYDWG